jgi:hypothetical protein
MYEVTVILPATPDAANNLGRLVVNVLAMGGRVTDIASAESLLLPQLPPAPVTPGSLTGVDLDASAEPPAPPAKSSRRAAASTE